MRLCCFMPRWPLTKPPRHAYLLLWGWRPPATVGPPGPLHLPSPWGTWVAEWHHLSYTYTVYTPKSKPMVRTKKVKKVNWLRYLNCRSLSSRSFPRLDMMSSGPLPSGSKTNEQRPKNPTGMYIIMKGFYKLFYTQIYIYIYIYTTRRKTSMAPL